MQHTSKSYAKGYEQNEHDCTHKSRSFIQKGNVRAYPKSMGRASFQMYGNVCTRHTNISNFPCTLKVVPQATRKSKHKKTTRNQ
jgi:hypothetical protein